VRALARQRQESGGGAFPGCERPLEAPEQESTAWPGQPSYLADVGVASPTVEVIEGAVVDEKVERAADLAQVCEVVDGKGDVDAGLTRLGARPLAADAKSTPVTVKPCWARKSGTASSSTNDRGSESCPRLLRTGASSA
jgi:hypothetical protein